MRELLLDWLEAKKPYAITAGVAFVLGFIAGAWLL